MSKNSKVPKEKANLITTTKISDNYSKVVRLFLQAFRQHDSLKTFFTSYFY